MVLERLIDPKNIADHKWELFFIGAIYATVAAFLSLWIFKGQASIVMITLTVIASIPLVHNIIKIEERKNLNKTKELGLLREHSKAITMFTYLFLGFVAAFLFVYLALPAQTVDTLFKTQMETITQITSSPTGDYISSIGTFQTIFFNNIKILILSIVFSFVYGAGAIFILTWNASVMAAAIGSFIKYEALSTVGALGLVQMTSLGLIKYMTHGIPEIIAYFFGALASGIFSIAYINKDLNKANFKRITKDGIYLIGIALIILIAAGLIEVFITPKIV